MRPTRLGAGLALGALLMLVIFPSTALAQPREADATASLDLVPNGSAQERSGATLYAFHCAVCHGATGRGFEEARSSFPVSHQSCTKCHRPANPRVLPLAQIQPNNAFSVGVAPALLGSGASVERFGSFDALLGYVRATMPRPFPGALSDDEYRKIVAFLIGADGGHGD